MNSNSMFTILETGHNDYMVWIDGQKFEIWNDGTCWIVETFCFRVGKYLSFEKALTACREHSQIFCIPVINIPNAQNLVC